jgi:hypothetical protein
MVVAVNCARRMKLGRGMNVTTTLFTTLSCEPMAQYTRMMPSTRVFRHSSVAAPFESSFAAAVSALVIGAIVTCGAGAGLRGTRAGSRKTGGTVVGAHASASRPNECALARLGAVFDDAAGVTGPNTQRPVPVRN